MKSKNAEAYLDSHVVNAEDCRRYSTNIGRMVIKLVHAVRFGEMTEDETDERVRNKAIAAFCSANCPKGCSFGADGGIGCAAKYRFIQKLDEE